MAPSHDTHKVERVTITLVPDATERSFFQVPSTFNRAERTYGWRHYEQINYMLVPTKISNKEIKIDLFVDQRKGKLQAKNLQHMLQSFVKSKVQAEWRGLRLESISRPTAAAAPEHTVVRGTIEEILGTSFDS
jgi:hypothetical protein